MIDSERIRKEPPIVIYRRSNPEEFWWCNSHKREATHIWNNGDIDHHCCNPKLGGILLPCFCVNLTNIAELENETKQA